MSDRLTQGNNYRLPGGDVGVMNVFEVDGSPTAQLSLFDRATSTDNTVRVRRDDQFVVGAQSYRVIDVVLAQDDRRGFVDVVPVE
jgi:hypothetical protein